MNYECWKLRERENESRQTRRKIKAPKPCFLSLLLLQQWATIATKTNATNILGSIINSCCSVPLLGHPPSTDNKSFIWKQNVTKVNKTTNAETQRGNKSVWEHVSVRTCASLTAAETPLHVLSKTKSNFIPPKTKTRKNKKQKNKPQKQQPSPLVIWFPAESPRVLKNNFYFSLSGGLPPRWNKSFFPLQRQWDLERAEATRRHAGPLILFRGEDKVDTLILWGLTHLSMIEGDSERRCVCVCVDITVCFQCGQYRSIYVCCFILYPNNM